MKDLVILVADKNTQYVLSGLLSRYRDLKIRQVSYDIYIHPQRDPGVYHGSISFLRSFLNQYEKALVFLDREGSGQERKPENVIGNEIKANLEKNGWKDRVEVIVFDPELEIWAWVNSPELANVLGWEAFSALKDFIRKQGLLQEGRVKPEKPKEAIETSLREKGIPRSSALYKEIAETVDFSKCVEVSFVKFTNTLKSWFSESDMTL